MARPRNPLPSVSPVSFPVAVNGGQYVRNKGGQRKDAGTSLEYLLAAKRAGATGWFLAPGDFASYGFHGAQRVAFVVAYSNETGITHPQIALDGADWDSRFAVSAACRSYGSEVAHNASGLMSAAHAVAILLHNVAARCSQLNPAAVAAMRKRSTLHAALLGNVDAVAAILRSDISHADIKTARRDVRSIGAMFTL